MKYKVHVIADNELPQSVNWAFVRNDGQLEFWLKQTLLAQPESLEAALEEAWHAYRDISSEQLMSWVSDLSSVS